MGEGVGYRPHAGPRPLSVRSSSAVSIQMPDGLIEELSKDVSSLASLVLHSARKQPTKEEQGACRQTGGSTYLWHLTHLGEPQSAAGVPAFVPWCRNDQPRLVALLGAVRSIIRDSDENPSLNAQEALSAIPVSCLMISGSE